MLSLRLSLYRILLCRGSEKATGERADSFMKIPQLHATRAKAGDEEKRLLIPVGNEGKASGNF